MARYFCKKCWRYHESERSRELFLKHIEHRDMNIRVGSTFDVYGVRSD